MMLMLNSKMITFIFRMVRGRIHCLLELFIISQSIRVSQAYDIS